MVTIEENRTASEPTAKLTAEGLGARLRAERRLRLVSVEALSATSDVSRSMISAIERGAKVPTILVLDRLATALGTSIARLVDERRPGRVMPMPSGGQRVLRDPGGWERRILSPVIPGREFEFMRTTIPGGVDAGEFPPHQAGSHEHVAVERGSLSLTLDGVRYLLSAGDAIYYAGDCVHGFGNPAPTDCVYYLVMAFPGELMPAHGVTQAHQEVPHAVLA